MQINIQELCMIHPNVKNWMEISKNKINQENFEINNLTMKYAIPLVGYYGLDVITDWFLNNTPSDPKYASMELHSYDPIEDYDEYLEVFDYDECFMLECVIKSDLELKYEEFVKNYEILNDDVRTFRYNANIGVIKAMTNDEDIVNLHTKNPFHNETDFYEVVNFDQLKNNRVLKSKSNTVRETPTFINIEDETVIFTYIPEVISHVHNRGLHVSALPYFFPERFDRLYTHGVQLKLMQYGPFMKTEDLLKIQEKGWCPVTSWGDMKIKYLDAANDRTETIKL